MRNNIFLLLLIVLTINACDNQNVPDCLKKRGDMTFFEKKVENFNNIEMYDAFNVELIKDTFDLVEVECSNNLKQNIGIKVDTLERKLIINDDSFCGIVRNNSDMPNLKIHYSNPISSFYIYGNSSVKSEDTVDIERYVFTSRAGKLNVLNNCRNVGVDVWLGTGEFIIKGWADNFHCDARGTSKIDVSQLAVKTADVETHSTGDIYVNVSDSIHCNFFWVGNVYCTQNPKSYVENQKNSTGKLITNYK